MNALQKLILKGMHPNRLLVEYPFIWGGGPVGSPAAAEHVFGDRGEGNGGTSARFDAVLMSAVKVSINLCAFMYALHTVFSGSKRSHTWAPRWDV